MSKKPTKEDDSRKSSESNDGQRRKDISDELSSEKFASDLQAGDQSDPVSVGSVRSGRPCPRTGTLSRRRFLGSMGAAAVVAAVGCKERSPSDVDVDGGPDEHDDGGVDGGRDGGPDIVQDGGQDGGPVVVEDGGQDGGPEEPDLSTLAAFPGAVGSGAIADIRMPDVRVIQVTNLNNSGSGSLRAACEAEGPRIIVFRIAGTIRLSSRIEITNPHIYIAGQTAPGQGIQLTLKDPGNWSIEDARKDYGTSNVFRLRSYNIIIRYMKFRLGFYSRFGAGRNGNGGWINFMNTDRRRMGDGAIDHCSFYWSHTNAWGCTARETDHDYWGKITHSNCIFAETLEYHPTGMNVFPQNEESSLKMGDLDFYRNLFANNNHRNPLLSGGHGAHRWVNNMIFNWGRNGFRIRDGVQFDAINNYFKQGTYAWQSGDTLGLRDTEMAYQSIGSGPALGNPNSYYVEGNLGPYFADGGDNNELVRYTTGTNAAATELAPSEWRRYTTHPAPPHSIPAIPASALEASLLPDVGASHRLDSFGNWIYNRDACDERVIDEVETGGGHKIAAEDAPAYSSSQSYIGQSDNPNNSYTAPGDYIKHNGIIYEARVDMSAPAPIPPNSTYWTAHNTFKGGFPTLASGTPYEDSNNDGVPDDWSIAAGISPTASNSGLGYHPSGYMYIELFLAGIKL